MENQTQTNDNMDDFFGQAKQGGDGFQWKTHVLSDKEPNIFRIAPPCKSLRTAGRWSVYDSLHYGYTIPNAENPDKPRHKPFRCVFKKNRGTGMIEQDCPECNLLESKEKEVEQIKAQQLAAGKSAEEAEEYVKGARRLLREHNLDKKHYVLAKNLAGEWGTLKVPHRAKQALDNLIEKYMKENNGKHPLAADSGVWFRFTRKGKGLQTEHYVEIENESLGGGRFQYKNGALTALDVEGIKKCPDLATMNDNKNLTYDQILALVRSNGDPAICVQIFSQGTRQTQTQGSQQTRAPAPQTQAAPPQQTYQMTQQAPQPLAPPAPSQVDPAAALQAQIAALQAQLVAAQTPAPTPQPGLAPVPQQTQPAPQPQATAPAASFSDLMKLDPKQFLATFPDPNKK